jgi:hypothetical protein
VQLKEIGFESEASELQQCEIEFESVTLEIVNRRRRRCDVNVDEEFNGLVNHTQKIIHCLPQKKSFTAAILLANDSEYSTQN